MNTFNELFLAAYDLFTNGRFVLAVEKLDEAAQIYPESDNNEFSLEDLYILRGTAKFSQNLLEDAKEDFEKALRTNPESSEACLGLGKYFLANGSGESAKKMFEWAVKNNPSHPGAQQALKDINLKLNLSEDDNTLFAAELSEMETEKDNCIEEASELFVQKRFEEAIKKLNIAKKNHETFLASIENFIAFNYLGLQEFNEAAKSAGRALELNPSSSQAYATLGEIDFLNNRFKSSRTKFSQALSYNNENEFARQGLKKVEEVINNSTGDKVNSYPEKFVGESLYR